MKPKVAIVKCKSYRQAQVDAAVRQSLELISGLDKTIKPGNRVLIKVNALMGKDPELGITTHPALVTAIVKLVKALGAIPLVGDSPGDGSANVHKVMSKCGFTKATEEAGGELISFEKAGTKDIPSPSQHKKIKTLKISKAVLKADVIINLPKLKTHGWTLYTGAIKNLFGCITGFNKASFHFAAPKCKDFSIALVDILEIVKPTINIMDAVMGMEGQGPTEGKPRLMGAILASFDAVALDAVAATAINYQPLEIDMIRIADNRQLGTGKLANIDVVGTPLKEIIKKDWEHCANTYAITNRIPSFLEPILNPIMQKILRIDPEIIQDKCKKCLVCVNNCPAKTIYFKDNTVKIDLSKCIMCYCCHELCPYKSIRLKQSWLAKVMGLGTSKG
ncbi:hypothetical protein A2291_07370 [candidate division WOR-1 bacterium RIFOXYB2_FULL_42_35]|uniref:4Fe-4S ferredoxin-type domain-containing protein n=1 Tax=candidate division WOR-1 bacterium RIFOXYC2_FULL_41_25 TaxID=1802586 RepID=A0A1F4TKC1_UNCSA|nr:MAG: hypothetical protein A2247_04230 [candidate division WOR-1 bacterium RIFOXYA2_FULL_41_14]OGC22725.1 MAG: hypothetical protein A2291_07370 [candidate division WOR-1 bacterium RIFOXYB2_FULL_42_35]OGC33146.1 MAG: hypothetical protein A2462_06265 [candidate division WOR-1 bacterium RIFOXYC2_FULL_41_25]OGC44216.1 MAG: hypothetical protein A2548_06995 [candidate division WOR-1 bacterium RIFOXYD2_FULL_41_8]